MVHERNLLQKRNIIEKLNEKRKNPPDFLENSTVYEAENRRNKLAPKFKPFRIYQNKRITVISNRRKIHKQKLKNKRKFAGLINRPGNNE